MVKKNFHLILIVFTVIFIIYGFIISNINSKRLVEHSKYTIAEIISDWHHKNNTGFGVDYTYTINNKKYHYTINIDLKKGKRYLLVYDSLRPSTCRVLGIYPINNEEVIPPVNGWKYEQVPIPIDRAEISKYIEKYH